MCARRSSKSAPRHVADRVADPSGVDRAAHRALARLDLPTGKPVLIALSGGGDSVALLHLFRGFVDPARHGVRVMAATVDHGLRPGSAAEAARVAGWCAAIGVPHRVLTWPSPEAGAGVQARARMARYALLAGHARSIDAAMVLTAHTADDQAETVAMRRARAPAGIGLAGIDDATLFERDVWCARPCLGLSRRDLRDWLTAQGIGWIDDPSNRDARFERVRVRTDLADDPQLRARLTETARKARAERRSKARAGAACLADAAAWQVTDGAFGADPMVLGRHAADAQRAAIGAVLTWTGRLERLADERRAGAALAFCRTARNGAAFTIAGCRLAKTAGRVVFAPDLRVARPAEGGAFARLMTLADLPLARAIAGRLGAPRYPAPPWHAQTGGLRRQDTLVAV